ncbi:MAG: hypothetical protein KJ057_10050 [Phycisphaerae bacterium]|nr:MAG: hypothetical protein F9K17_03120 [Phycisphaerae bacterium]MBE7458391.1 hypothetical protein [Planctomycetia bacterium]MCK6465205.1 hypothetical protein [Phycisphaerae bacterium]MCL4718800.1 hypothetical protein [Phycisphaerae bacterium]NUQ08885.1 hypothetical protein [Phycisphaerae bacterium]
MNSRRMNRAAITLTLRVAAAAGLATGVCGPWRVSTNAALQPAQEAPSASTETKPGKKQPPAEGDAEKGGKKDKKKGDAKADKQAGKKGDARTGKKADAGAGEGGAAQPPATGEAPTTGEKAAEGKKGKNKAAGAAPKTGKPKGKADSAAIKEQARAAVSEMTGQEQAAEAAVEQAAADRNVAAEGQAPPEREVPAEGQTPAMRARQLDVPFKNLSGDQLLGYINSMDLGLSGADLKVEVVGGNIVLRGNPEDVQKLEALILMLDAFQKTKVIEPVVLENKGSDEVSRIVTEALRDVFPAPTGRTQDQFKITPAGDNVVIVAALPEHIETILMLIDKIDALPPSIPGKWLEFEIRNRKASDVLREVQDMLSKIRTQLGAKSGELAIKAIDATNTIQVFAPESEREKIQAIIDAVDVAPKEDWGELKLVMFPLLHSNAEEFRTVLETLLRSPEDAEAANEAILRLSLSIVDPKDGTINVIKPIDVSRTVKLIADAGTNSILVATVEKNIPGFAELIRLLDSVPLAEDVDVEIIPLMYADANDLEERLASIFDDGPGILPDPGEPNPEGVPRKPEAKALAYAFSVTGDQRSNTLVIAGRPEQVALAKRIVEGLDKPYRYKYPIRLVRLQNGDAIRIGKVLTDMLEQRLEAYSQTVGSIPSEAERVFLTIDVNNNALILSASEENLGEITELVKSLDVPASRNLTQLGIIKCKHLSAETMAEKIVELWQRKIAILQEAEQFPDEPVIVADTRSNSLIVAAGPEDFAQIKQLVESLEQESAVDSIRIFGLKFADAMQMKTKFEELFDGLTQLMGEENQPTFISDERSNSLIVAATQDAMERVETLITKLDVESGPTTAVLEAYALIHANAVTLAAKMTRLFEDRAQGGGDSAERTPVVIVPFEGANSLVISASRDDHKVVSDLLKLLDQKSSLAKQVEIFPLQYARAEDVAEGLDQLFAESGGDADSGRPDAVAVVPDVRSNALIVWASSSQLEDVAVMIEKLDTTLPVRNQGVRVVKLKQALAENFAQVLQEAIFGENEDEQSAVMVTFREERDDGTFVEHKLLRQDVRFTPDPRTNSIFVYAPEKSIDALESMIRSIDQIRPTVNEIRMFELWNSNAETVVEMLRELYEEGSATGDQEEQNIRSTFELMGFPSQGIPALAGQTLRFVADVRTNTVVAAGAPIDLQMVEGLVRILDARDVQERLADVYRPNTLQPEQLSQALQDWLQQEEEVYQDTEESTSSYQRSEKKVSLVSIGGTDEEDRGAGLVIGASPRKLPQILELVQQLDRPEPQVRISVMVAEVILDDRLELGIEFAGQDLEFSQTAVLGPNGTVIGDNDAFDSVIGTDIGAIGSGTGFSFTITGEDFGFLVHALQTESRLEVLSRPTVVVENNRVGNIRIGDRIPIPTTSNVGDTSARTQTSFDYEDVGIELDVTPHITPDNYVRMDILAEISQLSNQTITLTEGLRAPVINERRLESSVTVKDGETVVLGGLITSSQEYGETKVPIFGDLPLFGPLFRSATDVSRRTELMVVLTVEVLRTPQDARQMSGRERDMGEASDWVKTHRFMEGLRITPDAALMGPQDPNAPSAGPSNGNGATPANRELYGPKPRRYGPDLSKPITKYGPKPPPDKPAEESPPVKKDAEKTEIARAEGGGSS